MQCATTWRGSCSRSLRLRCSSPPRQHRPSPVCSRQSYHLCCPTGERQFCLPSRQCPSRERACQSSPYHQSRVLQLLAHWIVPSVSLLDIQNHCKVLVRAIASSGSAHVMPLRTDRRCFPQVGSSGSMQPVSGDRIYSPGSSATPAAPAVFPEGSVCFNKATAGDVFPL